MGFKGEVGSSVLRHSVVLIALSLVIGGGLSAFGTASAAVDGDFEYELINGGTAVSIIGYHGIGGDVVLPSSILGKPVKKIANSAFEGCENIETISLPESLTAIGHYSFMTCRNLTSISIPANVTSIGIYVFNECGSLVSIDVDADNPNYASVDGVMYDKGLTKLWQCPGGKSGDLSIPEGVATITAWSLSYCDKLINVSMPDSVTVVEAFAFIGCSAMNSVRLSNNLTVIEAGVFSECSGLINVQIPQNTTAIGDWAFENCRSLTSVSIPTGVVSLGVHSFGNCEQLTGISVPETVAYISSGAFSGCTLLSDITLPEGISVIENALFMNCRSMGSLVIPSSVSAINENAFNGCSSLRNITIPANVTYIGDRAFSGCSGLSRIVFKGDAPSTGNDWADDWDEDLSVYFFEGATGFTTPTWGGLPCSLYPSIPGAPTNVAMAPLGDTVTISWNAPLDDGGAVVDYYIVYQNGVPICNTSTDRVTIYDLLDGEAYEFTVVAHNFVGVGEESSPVTFTVEEDDPEDDGSNGIDSTMVLLVTGAGLAIVALTAGLLIWKRKRNG